MGPKIFVLRSARLGVPGSWGDKFLSGRRGKNQPHKDKKEGLAQKNIAPGVYIINAPPKSGFFTRVSFWIFRELKAPLLIQVLNPWCYKRDPLFSAVVGPSGCTPPRGFHTPVEPRRAEWDTSQGSFHRGAPGRDWHTPPGAQKKLSQEYPQCCVKPRGPKWFHGPPGNGPTRRAGPKTPVVPPANPQGVRAPKVRGPPWAVPYPPG